MVKKKRASNYSSNPRLINKTAVGFDCFPFEIRDKRNFEICDILEINVSATLRYLKNTRKNLNYSNFDNVNIKFVINYITLKKYFQMKYPIHVNNEFKNLLKKHNSYSIIDGESQSNEGVERILEFCERKYEELNSPIFIKIDVNIYHRVIKQINKRENEGQDMGWLVPMFPNWHVLEYFIKITFKN